MLVILDEGDRDSNATKYKGFQSPSNSSVWQLAGNKRITHSSSAAAQQGRTTVSPPPTSPGAFSETVAAESVTRLPIHSGLHSYYCCYEMLLSEPTIANKMERLVMPPSTFIYLSPHTPEKHVKMTGRIPIGVGRMKSLKVLSLSNNLLRGSMPEGLISKLGATKVQKFIMPGNRLADVDTVSWLSPPDCSILYRCRWCSNKRRWYRKKLFLYLT